MIAAWLAYVLVAGSLLAVSVWALDALCRFARLPRRWSWLAGLLALVVLAAVPLWNPAGITTPPSRIGVAGDPASTRNSLSNGATAPTVPSHESSLSGGVARNVMLFAARTLHVNGVESWTVPASVAASLVLLFLVATVQIRYLKLRRGWPLLSLHGTPARLAPNSGPAVIGTVRPDIVIPRWLLNRSAVEQKLVLQHEGEHVAARDPLVIATGWICAVLVPWHPAVWFMLNRLRLAVEVDCDTRVLCRGAARESYGALLIELSEITSGLPAGASALADRTSHLERRLLAMNSKRPSYLILRLSGFATAAALCTLLACEARMPTAADVDRANAEAVEGIARQISLLTRGDSVPSYFIDGIKVTRTVAMALSAESIANIEVKRAAGERPSGEVRITTLGNELVPDLLVAGQFERKQSDTSARTRVRSAGSDSSALAVRDVGEDVVIQIRDPVTVSGYTRPMIIVDGVIQLEAATTAALDLAGDNIETVEIVRGAAAVKLYGERARNGVISITTKR